MVRYIISNVLDLENFMTCLNYKLQTETMRISNFLPSYCTADKHDWLDTCKIK